MTDPLNLERFMTTQEPVFDGVLNELRAGRERTHWMWFIFPQLRGLGRSSMAEYYGIGSLAEARTYLAHPVLGRRLEFGCFWRVFHLSRELRCQAAFLEKTRGPEPPLGPRNFFWVSRSRRAPTNRAGSGS